MSDGQIFPEKYDEKRKEHYTVHGIRVGDLVTVIDKHIKANVDITEKLVVAELEVDSVKVQDSKGRLAWLHFSELLPISGRPVTIFHTKGHPDYQKEDPVNHPSHYNAGAIEVLEVIEDQGWGEGFCKGNVLKYTMRAGRKRPDKEVEDLQKADWYLRRAIELTKAKQEGRKPCRPNEMPK